MYGGFEVYKTYLAVKLHFTSKSYDYIKYEGKVNAKLDTFTSRNDRYFFHKLSKRFKEDEILHFFVANFAKDDKTSELIGMNKVICSNMIIAATHYP